MYFIFAFGDNKYISVLLENDNNLERLQRIHIYPPCTSKYIASGDPTHFLSSIASTNIYPETQQPALRAALAGGDEHNWNVIATASNDKLQNLPIRFEFINDDIDDKLYFRVGLESERERQCTYRHAVDTHKGIKIFFTADWVYEKDVVAVISNFMVNG